MRKILLAAMLLSASPVAAQVTVTALPFASYATNHADLFEGAVYLGGTGNYPTFNPSDVFGAVTSTSPEPGSYVFNDFSYSYGTQILAFRTAAPVVISGFDLYLYSAGGLRAFDSVKLRGSVDNVTFSDLGGLIFPTNDYASAYGSDFIRVRSTFASQAYQYFSLEGSDVQTALGARVVELDAIGGMVSGGVPEPATWAMMIMGFGAIGGALRGRRRVRVAAI